jgi:hypothetical protein
MRQGRVIGIIGIYIAKPFLYIRPVHFVQYWSCTVYFLGDSNETLR